MGEVYRARDTRLEREVAIKVLSPDRTSSEPARERFQREAGTIAASGDLSRARASYDDFLTLWKQADTDVPLVKQAQAEAARLR